MQFMPPSKEERQICFFASVCNIIIVQVLSQTKLLTAAATSNYNSRPSVVRVYIRMSSTRPLFYLFLLKQTKQ